MVCRLASLGIPRVQQIFSAALTVRMSCVRSRNMECIPHRGREERDIVVTHQCGCDGDAVGHYIRRYSDGRICACTRAAARNDQSTVVSAENSTPQAQPFKQPLTEFVSTCITQSSSLLPCQPCVMTYVTHEIQWRIRSRTL